MMRAMLGEQRMVTGMLLRSEVQGFAIQGVWIDGELE